jgi:hypothetical protein
VNKHTQTQRENENREGRTNEKLKPLTAEARVETAAGDGANTEAGEEEGRIKIAANLLTNPQQAEVGEGGSSAQQTSEERKTPFPRWSG